MSAAADYSSRFPTTRWTLMARLRDPETRPGALERLCSDYWAPVYCSLRRRFGSENAQDLTQDFLLMMLRQEVFERANPEHGRLRSWVLGSLDRFLANRRRVDTAARHGGGMRFYSLQSDDLKLELEAQAAAASTPAEAFDRAWVSALLRRTLDSLRAQYAANGKAAFFDAALPWLLHDGDFSSQPASADACGLTLSNFRVQLHRLRGHYRDALRSSIAETVGGEEEVQAELQHLFAVSGHSL